jgi:hypothetical protein
MLLAPPHQAGTNDQVIDDGTLCPDCTGAPPSTTNRTNATSKLQVTVPATLPADATQFRIYASLDGSFESPALLGTYPAAQAGPLEKNYLALGFNFDDGGQQAELGSDLVTRRYVIEVWVIGLSGAEGRNLANAVRDSRETDGLLPLRDVTAPQPADHRLPAGRPDHRRAPAGAQPEAVAGVPVDGDDPGVGHLQRQPGLARVVLHARGARPGGRAR